MTNLAKRVSEKTGLSLEECDGIIKVISHEVLMGLREYGEVKVPAIGVFRKEHTEHSNKVYLYLCDLALDKLKEPYTGDTSNEIILK